MFTVVLLTLLGAYLVGSLPTGYLVGRAKGVDLRSQGSGNIGATNALRVLGKPAGSFVLLVDGLKGWLGVTWVPVVAVAMAGSSGAAPRGAWLGVLGGVGAVLGHNFTCWLRFKGGKGIATSAGVLLGLMPLAFVAVLSVFLVALLAGRIVSVASISAAAALPVAAWIWHRDPVLLGFAVLLAVLAIWRHRGNIQRLMNGTEPRMGQAKAPASAGGGEGAGTGQAAGKDSNRP